MLFFWSDAVVLVLGEEVNGRMCPEEELGVRGKDERHLSDISLPHPVCVDV